MSLFKATTQPLTEPTVATVAPTPASSTIVPAIDLLRVFSPGQWEDFALEWAHSLKRLRSREGVFDPNRVLLRGSPRGREQSVAALQESRGTPRAAHQGLGDKVNRPCPQCGHG